MHPARSTILYLKEIKFVGLIYVIGSQAFAQALSAAGFDIVVGVNLI